MILITGAAGQMGGAVLAEVNRRRLPFCALYRSQSDARNTSSWGERVVADFSNPETMARALTGVTLVYLVCSPIPNLVELESAAIEACLKAGVEHIILNSALGAADYGKSYPAWHRQVEDKLKTSGLAYTILRPNSFMQNIVTFYGPAIRARSSFYASTGSGRTSYLDIRDIAAAIAQILTHPHKHRDRTYELNGPDAVSGAELADLISQIAGRKITYVDLPEDTQRESMLKLGIPAWQVTALLDLQAYYRAGRGGDLTPVLSQILGAFCFIY